MSYVNPISLPGQPFTSLADPTVLWHSDRYWLFVSGRQAWSSIDLVHWEHHRLDLPRTVVAPTLVEHAGTIYLSGNGRGMFAAPHPLGPWQEMGPVVGANGSPIEWVDPMLFVDDERVYCYHNLAKRPGTLGVFVTELDPAAGLRRARSDTIHCFGHVPEHTWERWGDANEFAEVAWIEAPWMIKYGGQYHLQYSGAGTEWRSYAVGVYTSRSPTGPFTYDGRSPLLRRRGGLLDGPGHHAIVRGPGGALFNLYHVLFRNEGRFDRRLALDPVSFDERGRLLLHGPSETPCRVPGSAAAVAGGDLGWRPLATDKPARASSEAPGRGAAYAVDPSVRTWWQAADAVFPQWLEVDLAGEMCVRAFRIIFAPTHAPGCALGGAYRYTFEGSLDSAGYRVLFDGRSGSDDRDVQYHELEPTRVRFIRVRLEAGYDGAPAGIIDISPFG
jgi:hypothetical protein